MLRQLDGTPLDPTVLDALTIERVLFEFDGPRTWVSRTPDGTLLLLHQCGQGSQCEQFLMVPISDITLESLEALTIDLRTALTSPQTWVVEFDRHGIRRLMETSTEAVAEWIPDPGVKLFPEECDTRI
jgi:hypothetical protein